CSGPCASDPATGWPPMKRGCVTAAQTGPFVEPTSVTVQRSPLASTTAATWAGRVATGEATTASFASRTASSSRSPGSSIAPRSAARASAPASGSNPATWSTPARLAASPIEAPISPVPTTASRETATGSADDAAHQRAEGAELGCEVAELGGRNLLRPVAEGLFGRGVHLDDHAVGTGGNRRAGEREHEVAAPRRVRRVDDHGQVRLLLQDRDGADVEREPHRGLEGLDPTLAEDHARVPLLDDVLGRHQELLDGRREAALEQHRLVRPTDLAEEREVGHVARADLDHVGRLDHRLDVPRVHQLRHERQAGLLARLLEDVERLLAEALERVRRRARLERRSEEHTSEL